MSFTLTTSGAIVIAAGANISSTASSSSAILQQFSDEAESFINTTSRYDWVTNYANLNAQASGALFEAASNLAAMSLIAYDMSGFPNRAEAESRINLLNFKATKIVDDLLKDDSNRQFVIDGATGVA